MIKEHNLEGIEKFVYLDPTSPSGLRWKVSIKGKTSSKPVFEHDVAGSKKIEKNGKATAWRINIGGKHLYVHRIIWYLLYNEDPGQNVIDHLDCNPLNNDYSNLRCVPRSINARNRRKTSNNKTGITGVTYRERIQYNKLYRYFIATWLEGQVSRAKSFSVDKLGFDLARELATKFRKEKIEELNASGYGYTEEHGS